MKTILVLSLHPDFAETIRAGLDAERYRVVHRLSVDDAEPLLVHGLVAVCIVDVDLMGVEGIWVIERLRRHDSKSPVIAYTAEIQSEWEEEAFLRGATHVLTKPVRSRLLNSLLDRLLAAPVQSIPSPPAKFTWQFARISSARRQQCRTDTRCIAGIFAHPHLFAECRGDVKPVPFISARNPGRQPRRNFFKPTLCPAQNAAAKRQPQPARRGRHRPFNRAAGKF